MAQAHGDRLTATDASFLAQEGPSSHMHIGAVLVFEGPPPSYDEFVDHIRSRLHLVPRYRQKLAFPPISDRAGRCGSTTRLNLEYHVRHSSLPAPGRRRPAAQPDRRALLPAARPLEAAVGDVARAGARGQSLRADQQDAPRARGRHLGRRPRDGAVRREPVPSGSPPRGRAVAPHAEPRELDLAARGIRGMVRTPVELAGRAAAAARRPAESLGAGLEVLEGVGEIAWATLNPAPDTPLNVEIGPHRRFVFLREELDDFKLVKDAFGGTVNDVVLTAVSRAACRRGYASRGARTRGSSCARSSRSRSAAHEQTGHLRQPARR